MKFEIVEKCSFKSLQVIAVFSYILMRVKTTLADLASYVDVKIANRQANSFSLHFTIQRVTFVFLMKPYIFNNAIAFYAQQPLT